MHDSITGLANRTQLTSELNYQLATCEEGAAVALIFIDLDRFEIINDSLGHSFGDRLLVAMTRTLCAAVRPTDLVVRLAGDEFVVLLTRVELATVRRLAETVVQRLREPISLEGRILHVTASVGYSMSGPGSALRNCCGMQIAPCTPPRSMVRTRQSPFMTGLQIQPRKSCS